MNQAINAIQDLINLVYDLYPDEPETYELEQRIERAKQTIAQLEAAQ
jgi:hypothetical protein